MPRGAAPTPCRLCPKSQDGKPAPGADMVGRNAAMWECYQATQAGYPPPDDEQTRQMFALVRTVEGQVRLAQMSTRPLAEVLAAAVTGGK